MIVLGVVVAAVILLRSGGESRESGGEDGQTDVVIGDGPRAPEQFDSADIRDASVLLGGDELTFTAVMGAHIPDLSEDGSLEWRWEITEGELQTWILTANVALEPTAHLIATQKDYSSSTIDDSLPGDVTVDDRTVTVTLRLDDLEGFPERFRWKLLTTLDASRGPKRSATAHDLAPDEGAFEFVGD